MEWLKNCLDEKPCVASIIVWRQFLSNGCLLAIPPLDSRQYMPRPKILTTFSMLVRDQWGCFLAENFGKFGFHAHKFVDLQAILVLYLCTQRWSRLRCRFSHCSLLFERFIVFNVSSYVLAGLWSRCSRLYCCLERHGHIACPSYQRSLRAIANFHHYCFLVNHCRE